MIIALVFCGLMIGFVIGVKIGESSHFEEIQTIVDLMRIDGAIRW